MTNLVRHKQCGVAGGIMSEFAQTLNDLAKLCGKSEHQCPPAVCWGEASFEPDYYPADDRG